MKNIKNRSLLCITPRTALVRGQANGYHDRMGDLAISHRKEHFSVAYVEALAYTAGYADGGTAGDEISRWRQ
jgi:hypothetical protein